MADIRRTENIKVIEKLKDNKYIVEYTVEGKKKPAYFEMIIASNTQDEFKVELIMGKKDKYKLPLKYDLMKEEDCEVIWAGILQGMVDDQLYIGQPPNIWEALTHAMKVIRGEVDEKPFTEDESKKHELDTDTKKLLESKDIFNQYYDILRTCRDKPLVREEANSLTVYISILSCKVTDPLMLSLEGPSQSGKTFLTVRSTDFFTEDMVDIISSGSKTAYKYTDTINEEGVRIVKMWGKCIMFLERSESHELISSLKPLMSHDNKRVRDRTTQKSDGGEIRSQITEYFGWPSFIIMGTQPPKNEEIRNRGLILSPEKSKDKDDEMNRSDWESFGSMTKFNEPTEILETWKKAHDWLPMSSVSVHIFSKYLMLLKAEPRERSLLFGMISTISLLHTLQRPAHDGMILCSFEDCVIALALFERAYEHSKLGLSKQQLNVLKHLFDMKDRLGIDRFELDQIYFDIRDISIEKTTDTLKILVKEDLRKYLDVIEERGYIKKIKIQKKQDSWRILSDNSIINFVPISGIFIENILSNIESIKSDLLHYDEKYDITYPSDEYTEDKLYNHVMRKCYFNEESKNYNGRPSCVYRIFDDIRLRDGLFSNEYRPIGRKESEKIQEQEFEQIKSARERTRPKNFIEFVDTPGFDDWEKEEIDEADRIDEELAEGLVKLKKTRTAKTSVETNKPTPLDPTFIRRGRR